MLKIAALRLRGRQPANFRHALQELRPLGKASMEIIIALMRRREIVRLRRIPSGHLP
jgi:hypothetical protein